MFIIGVAVLMFGVLLTNVSIGIKRDIEEKMEAQRQQEAAQATQDHPEDTAQAAVDYDHWYNEVHLADVFRRSASGGSRSGNHGEQYHPSVPVPQVFVL
eukprot:288313-Hanusia_phi.AAC.1